MAGYKPSGPFIVPMQLYLPSYRTAKGVKMKEYPDEGIPFFGTFRKFGGTETNVNGLVSVVDTGMIETWYRPDINADCRIVIDEVPYEVMGTPENINMRNQYLLIKVKAVRGGA